MKAARFVVAILGLGILATVLCFRAHRASSPTVSAPPISQDVYLWQHAWTPAVIEAARTQQPRFHRLVILSTEISLRSLPGKATKIHPDYAPISATSPAIGIAVRVGPATGSDVYLPESKQTNLLCASAVEAIAEARAANVSVMELQIDFDCAESKLPGYRNWVSAVKSAIAPVPVVITALPSWLAHPAFTELARDAGGFVIQVHSLHQPTGPDADMTICNPTEAEQAVTRASQVGVPFRVALPTYSYLAGFSADGNFLGLSAEGPLPGWPTGTIMRCMRSDPAQLAPLVSNWTAHRLPNLTGIIWYRLPVAGDSMNWSAITLQAVMAGRVPRCDLIAQVESSKPGLSDVYVQNTGDADATGRFAVSIESDEPAVIAEGINGFDRFDLPAGGVIFRDGSTDRRRIAPGERLQVGWLRLSTDKEVHAHVTASP